MVSSLLAPKVVDLIHQTFEAIVQFLHAFFFKYGESLELLFFELHLGDLVTFVHHLKSVPYLLLALQAFTLLYSSL
jgi:hypothetical protein